MVRQMVFQRDERPLVVVARNAKVEYALVNQLATSTGVSCKTRTVAECLLRMR